MSKIDINNLTCEIHATNNNGDILLQVRGDDIDQLILITILIANVSRVSNIPFENHIAEIYQIYKDIKKSGALDRMNIQEKENDT